MLCVVPRRRHRQASVPGCELKIFAGGFCGFTVPSGMRVLFLTAEVRGPVAHRHHHQQRVKEEQHQHAANHLDGLRIFLGELLDLGGVEFRGRGGG